MSRIALLGGATGSSLGPQRPTITRAPLGPFPPGSYDRVLPVPIPAGRDLHYYRGQFCGLRVPGAPYVPGGPQPGNTDLVMACLLDNYPRAWQDAFLERYASYGYTHLQRSYGHALYYGSSLASFIDLSRRARAMGLFCDQWLIAAETPGFLNDQDWAYWEPILAPVIRQLLDAGVVDLCCPSWQMDGVNRNAPGNPTLSIIAGVANLLPRSVPVYTHWINEAMAWWYDDGRGTVGQWWEDDHQRIFVNDRFSWWRACAPYLTGAHHQGNTTMARTDPTQYQGRQRDTLNAFVDGRMGQSIRTGVAENFRLDEFECTAQDQFDGNCTEDEGDLVGYILTCTKADGFAAGMSGYGNGARRPDGTAL